MRDMIRAIALGMGLAALSVPVNAQDPGMAAQVTAALEAGSGGDWDAAQALLAGVGPVGRDLVTWHRLRDGAGEFADYQAFLERRSDWPGRESIRQNAERAMGSDLPAAAVAGFFAEDPPQTGEGAVALARALTALALARALTALGRGSEAKAMLVRFWQEQGLDEDGFNAVIAAYPGVVQPHHLARADAMLWRWRTEDAGRLLPHLEDGERALVRARMGYIGKAGDISERVALVPERLRGDPGLAYDRFSWLSDRGDWTDAISLLQDRSVSSEALGQPWRWGSWRRVLARWQMREGNPAVAYDLAIRHFLTAEDTTSYADLEWLAGYLALTYLDDPTLAITHFERVEAAVEGPISLSRAGYWLGRAHEALDAPEAAQAAYARGAQHQTSFYGLLAAEALGLPLDPALAGGEADAQWRGAAFLQDDMAQAGLYLLAAGERGAAVLFFADLAGRLPEAEMARMGQMFLDMDETFFALLSAKTGVRRGFTLQDTHYPLHGLGRMDLPVDPALALAIARQESEFRVDAGSPVGALGIMQLMPGTAEEVARELGLSYSRARLVTDWQYNTTLGARYLANLQDRFGDSPVLIAVGYNAGPGRARDWISARGDPRRGEMDVVDWIEHIPFRETRNYVMRVTEGIPVYRARLTGQATGPVRFRDLLVGAPPFIRPMARPEPASDPVAEALSTAAEAAPADMAAPSLAPRTSLRPVPRPAGR